MRPSARAALLAAVTLLLGLVLPLVASPANADRHPKGDGKAVAGHSLRSPVTDEDFYFVMADRFANGRRPTTPAVWAPTRWSPGSTPPRRASTTAATSRG